MIRALFLFDDDYAAVSLFSIVLLLLFPIHVSFSGSMLIEHHERGKEGKSDGPLAPSLGMYGLNRSR